MEEDVAALSKDDCRKRSRPGHPPGDHRVEHNRRRLWAGAGMLWTLDNALWCSRYHNFMHRHCDLIEIANRSNLADSFCSGIIQTNGTGLFKTPTYYAQQLYATYAGSQPLRIGIDAELPCDPAWTPVPRSAKTARQSPCSP